MEKEKELVSGVSIGIVFGVLVGIATDNLGLWIALGISIGAGLSYSYKKRKEK